MPQFGASLTDYSRVVISMWTTFKYD